jgi:indole-3-glycerol phosphate synthase
MVERVLRQTGMGFMMAPIFHSSMREVMVPRKELGIRTMFNLLGPLVNPAGVKKQLIGIFDPELLSTVAKMLMDLGSERAMVVNGSGLDEITNTGRTNVIELQGGQLSRYQLRPEDFEMEPVSISAISGGDPLDNARIMMSILKGRESPRSDIVALNAGAAIYLAGMAPTIHDGVQKARRVIVSGKGMKALERFGQASLQMEEERQHIIPTEELASKRLVSRVMMERGDELCDHLIGRIRGTEAEKYLDGIDPALLDERNILTQIILQRILDVEDTSIRRITESGRSRRGFSEAISESEGLAVIGEYKPRSPTSKPINVPPEPLETIGSYQRAGVTALSVLTEPRFFGGSSGTFSSIRDATPLPMLYKDFVFSKGQIELAASLGADAVLLIASALEPENLDSLLSTCQGHRLEPLLKIHNTADIGKLDSLSNGHLIRMCGVNTRDLTTMSIDTDLLQTMLPHLDGHVRVAESGIRSTGDLENARGYDAVLIGSMFMSSSDLQSTVHEVVRISREVSA